MSREETDEAVECLHLSQRAEVALREQLDRLVAPSSSEISHNPDAEPEEAGNESRIIAELRRRLVEVELEKKGAEMALMEEVREGQRLRRRLASLEEGGVSVDSASTGTEKENEAELVEAEEGDGKDSVTAEREEEGSGVMVDEEGSRGQKDTSSPSTSAGKSSPRSEYIVV